MKDPFILTTARMSQKEGGIIRISPEHYSKLLKVRCKTGLSIGAIAEKCIDFAMERLEIVEEDEDADT